MIILGSDNCMIVSYIEFHELPKAVGSLGLASPSGPTKIRAWRGGEDGRKTGPLFCVHSAAKLSSRCCGRQKNLMLRHKAPLRPARAPSAIVCYGGLWFSLKQLRRSLGPLTCLTCPPGPGPAPEAEEEIRRAFERFDRVGLAVQSGI